MKERMAHALDMPEQEIKTMMKMIIVLNVTIWID